MKHFYTPEEALKWSRRAFRIRAFAITLVALALVVCIILCTQVNTANAQTMLGLCILLFTLAGWAGILLLYYGYAPARALSDHIGGMLTGEAVPMEGVLTVHRESFRIPKSVTVRKATLQTADGPVSLSVSAALAPQLPQDGAPVRLLTVRKYIAGFEVRP